MGDLDLRRYHAGWHRALRFVAQRIILRGVVRSVTRVSVTGADNLKGLKGPCVVVANHASHLDATLIVTSLPYSQTKNLAVAAAADYFYSRWWKKAATSLFFNTYAVHRTGERKTKGTSLRLIEEGVSVAIFPEGTRSRDGKLKRFTPGAAALSVTTQVPMVPIALIGTYEAMPVGRWWPVSGRPTVQMLIGKPMYPRPGEKFRDLNDRVAGHIAAMLAKKTAYITGDQPPPDFDDPQDPGGESRDKTTGNDDSSSQQEAS